MDPSKKRLPGRTLSHSAMRRQMIPLLPSMDRKVVKSPLASMAYTFPRSIQHRRDLSLTRTLSEMRNFSSPQDAEGDLFCWQSLLTVSESRFRVTGFQEIVQSIDLKSPDGRIG